MQHLLQNYRVAVLVPCYNEEATIASVVRGFKAELPFARIYVYDNNSKDQTVSEARKVGAIVRHEPLQGKGSVVRRMFSDIDADIYIMVDGDDTYDPPSATNLLEHLVNNNLDLVNGARYTDKKKAYRFGHRFGNVALTSLISYFFGNGFKDILSGYKVFQSVLLNLFLSLLKVLK